MISNEPLKITSSKTICMSMDLTVCLSAWMGMREGKATDQSCSQGEEFEREDFPRQRLGVRACNGS